MGVAGTPRPKEDGGVGPSVADFDHDGDFDLFVANYGHSALYRNDGGLKFTDVSRERGIDLNGHGVTSGWGDLDNDGLPDLYVGNFIAGQPLYRDALFINDAQAFVESLPDVILKHDATHGVQFVDFDRDGRLDLALTNNDPEGGGHPLLRNTAAMRGRSIAVEVTDPNARRSRAGSEVRAYRAGTRQIVSSGLVDSGSGYCSQNEMPVHLGIPSDWKGRIDIEVITIAAGVRHASLVRNVDPDDYRGRSQDHYDAMRATKVARSSRLLAKVPVHQLFRERHALVFHQLHVRFAAAVERHLDLPRLRKHLRVLDRRFVVERVGVDRRVALRHLQRIAVVIAGAIEPRVRHWSVTSTTSDSPSHFPTDHPIHAGAGLFSCVFMRTTRLALVYS